jgi:hypothetical protein
MEAGAGHASSVTGAAVAPPVPAARTLASHIFMIRSRRKSVSQARFFFVIMESPCAGEMQADGGSP